VAVVLDASAALAWWLGESGGDVVEAAVATEGAVLSSVNFAEVLAKLDDRRPGFSATLPNVSTRLRGEATATATGDPIAAGAVVLESFTIADAVVSATMRAATKPAGLSLGDRACLTVAKRLDLDAMTADRTWSTIAAAVGVSVRLIR
jgi:ribonuclease VapC